MGLSQADLDVLVALLSECLRVRAGEVLTDLVIADRARNAAALLDLTYRMQPIATPHVFSCTWGARLATPHDERCRCNRCGKPPGGDHLPGDES